jgi:hypothetical protein
LGLEAQKEAHRTAIISRLPVIMITGEESSGSVVIGNVGIGPADIFQVELRFKSDHVVLRSGEDGRRQLEEIDKFLVSALDQIEMPGANPDGIEVHSPTVIYRAEQELKLFNFGLPTMVKFPKIKTIFQQLAVRVCYMDVTGEFQSSDTFGNAAELSDCGSKPQPFANLD